MDPENIRKQGFAQAGNSSRNFREPLVETAKVALEIEKGAGASPLFLN
jgi:hypothetical protein